MSKPTYEQQSEREQEYHRIEALRQAHAYTAQTNQKPTVQGQLEIADKFYQFIKSGVSKQEAA